MNRSITQGRFMLNPIPRSSSILNPKRHDLNGLIGRFEGLNEHPLLVFLVFVVLVFYFLSLNHIL